MPPTLETADGKPVDVTPVDPDAVNREFAAAMADDGPDTQAPPKRQPKSATTVTEAPSRSAGARRRPSRPARPPRPAPCSTMGSAPAA